MTGFNLSNTTMSAANLENLFNKTVSGYKGFDFDELKMIFQIALADMNRFPIIKAATDEKTYIERWIKNYYDAMNKKPSAKVASPKSSCTDPAIRVIVKNSQGQTEKASNEAESIHNLYMSAENIQGSLLEEYIASNVREYGFLWCNGNILKAIDFCNSDGTMFLQIKNKSNTENSSSSSIRLGTNIEKWYRLGTKTRNGIHYPDYKWEILNKLISTHRSQGCSLPMCNMNEADYLEFLIEVANNNSNIITEK